MPIGKNAIKRVSSSASGSASDVKEAKTAEVKIADTRVEEAPKTEAPATEVAPAKEATKKATKKTTKKATKSEKQGFEHLAIGDDLPYYLL
jgi:hypothetical protein